MVSVEILLQLLWDSVILLAAIIIVHNMLSLSFTC